MKANKRNRSVEISLSKVILLVICNWLFVMVNAQQIGFEKNWSSSHNDLFTNISQIQMRNFSKGETYQDSIVYDTVSGVVFYYPQFILSKNTPNGNNVFKLLYSDKDTIVASGNQVRFFSNIGFHNASNFSKVAIVGGYADFISMPNQFDNYVLCIDTSGIIISFTYLNLYPLSEPKGVYDVFALSNGDVYVAGWQSGGSNADSYLSKIDIYGNLVYSTRYFIPGYQAAYHVTQLSDGAFLMCGRSDSSAMFFKVNPINGDSIFMHTSLTIPGANNTLLTVKYFEELSDNTYLSMVFDSVGQGYLCRLDTNFNLLSYHQTNGDFNNFFRVNDNEYIGYQSTSPVKIYAFDSIGNTLWTLPLPTPENVSFVPDGHGGLMGAGNVRYSIGSNQSDYYLVRIDSVGYPAGPICHNPPTIHWAHADIVGANYANLSDSATENLKYSDVLAHNWYFQDGEHAYGQYVSHQIDAILYPDSFWCMLVVTDAIGCTDTLTINAYTNEVIYPNPDWPPNSVDEKIASVPRNDVRIFPNPAQDAVIVQHEYNKGTIELLDNMGRVVHQQQITKKQTVLDLKDNVNGLYFIKVSSPDELTVVKKLVVEK